MPIIHREEVLRTDSPGEMPIINREEMRITNPEEISSITSKILRKAGMKKRVRLILTLSNGFLHSCTIGICL